VTPSAAGTREGWSRCSRQTGTWTPALVDLDRVEVTVVCLYGLMDETSDA
jgi:hypothetical protein